jgi:hypothetical protein
MADIFGIVEDALVARLSDPLIGFNANFQQIQAIKPAYQALNAIAFDFNPESENVNPGRVSLRDLESTSDTVYPFLMYEVRSGADDMTLKFNEFSGPVIAEVEVMLSFESEGIRDFNTLPNAVIGAMVATFNSVGSPNIWGSGVNYNGGISVVKSQTQTDAANWFKSLLFTAQFNVVA